MGANKIVLLGAILEYLIKKIILMDQVLKIQHGLIKWMSKMKEKSLNEALEKIKSLH